MHTNTNANADGRDADGNDRSGYDRSGRRGSRIQRYHTSEFCKRPDAWTTALKSRTLYKKNLIHRAATESPIF